MIFIDASNLNKSAEYLGFKIDYKKFKQFFERFLEHNGFRLVRPYYYSVEDKDSSQPIFHSKLRNLGYELKIQEIIKTNSKYEEKEIDIKIATDLLYFGFNNSYDLALLCTGDKDFLPAIERIKDLGKWVYIAAFEHSCAENLLKISDHFINLSECKNEIEYR